MFHKLVGDETLPQAIEFFDRAVELDPEFADAWAHLALAHLNLQDHTDVEDPSVHYAAAEAAVKRAEKIHPESSLIERAKALILCTKRDFFGAVQAYERAYELDPENPLMIFGYGYALNSVGLHESAIEVLEKAERLDPSAPLIPQILGIANYALNKQETSIFHHTKANQLGYVPARVSIALVEGFRGNTQAAYGWMRDYMKDAPPWFRKRLRSPIARHFYYAAAIKRTRFAKWVVGRKALSRIKKPTYKPVFWDALILLDFCAAEDYYEFLRTHSLAYGLFSLAYLFQPSSNDNAIFTHKEFPQFIEDMGLVKIWQTYGWPKQIQPNPGTDGSGLQFTVSLEP